MGEARWFSNSNPTPPGAARQQVPFFCFAKRKEPKKRRPQSAIPSGFPALLGRSGFLINSHDPLRVHVLKHIRQNSLTRLRYSVAEQGREKQIQKQNLQPAGGRKAPTYSKRQRGHLCPPYYAFEFLSPVRRLDISPTSGDLGEHCPSSAAGHVLCALLGRVAQPHLLAKYRGNPKGAANRGQLLWVTFLGKTRKVTCCQATPGGFCI